jgi:prepilin-type N-terminal cleavage/methylation domain-containing protein
VRTGFTLVEVLTTVALMAIILPVAMYGLQISLEAGTVARRRAEAATLAQGKLQELAATAMGMQSSGGSNEGGEFGEEYPGYRWDSTMTQIDLNMVQLDVRVTWVQRNQERSVGVSTWVYRSAMVQ